MRPATPALRLLVLLALTLLAAIPTVSVAPADAAGYTVWSCRAPDGSPIDAGAWRPGGTAGTRTDDCASGGALRAELAQTDGAASAVNGYRFVAPNGATIERYRLWRWVDVSATSDGSSYAAGISEADELGVQAFSSGCLVSPAGCSFGVPGNPLDASNLIDVSGGFPGVAIAARCATATGCTATSDPAASIALYRSAIDITDNDAPVVGGLVGTLFDPQAAVGRHSVLVPIVDVGGGIARTDLLIDGAVVQSVPTGGRCVEPYVVAEPCARQADRGFIVDTTGFGAGVHQAVVRAVDAAGNVTDSAATPFAVPAPVILPPPPDPIVVPQRALRISLARKVTLPEEERTTGTARWADGSPASGVWLDVLAAPLGAPAGDLEWLSRVRVSASGSFTLPKSRESRTLRVMPADAADVATPADVDLVAPLRARLKGPRGTVRNGGTATLRGTITGAGEAVEDLQVLVQAIVGGRWSTVDSVSPSESGSITWKYRFRRTVKRAAYRFRLVVPRTASLPWNTTVSPREIVRVLPRQSRR